MIKCIAIDDEPMALEVIGEYVSKVHFLEMIAVFRDAVEALGFIQENPVELVFLDINMPEITGMQFIKSLPANRPEIIFCTAYSEYAVDSYDFEAVDYLLKPIEFDRFLKAAIRVNERLTMKNNKKGQTGYPPGPGKMLPGETYLFIKSGTEWRKLNIDKIKYIEATGNYSKFHTENGSVMALQSMKETMDKLPKEFFFRVHKSYIVSFRYIDHIERHQLKVDQALIPVGNLYRGQFQQWLNNKLK